MDNKGKDIILYISIFGIHYRLNDLPPNNTMTPEPWMSIKNKLSTSIIKSQTKCKERYKDPSC